MLCVRNTQLERLHSGLTPIIMTPVIRTGDHSDVFVHHADGRRITWTEVSHINDDEIRLLMQEIVNCLDTFHLEANDPAFAEEIDRWMAVAETWDVPALDPGLFPGAGRP